MDITYKLIAAVSHDGVVGIRESLPWYVPSELKHFKKLTVGHLVLMGRRTAMSLGKPLPSRNCIVLTHDTTAVASLKEMGFSVVFTSVEEMEATLRKFYKNPVVWVIGGPNIWRQFIGKCKEVHLSLIQTTVTTAENFADLVKFDPFTEIPMGDFKIVERIKYQIMTQCGKEVDLPWTYLRGVRKGYAYT